MYVLKYVKMFGHYSNILNGMKAEKIVPEYDFVNFPLIATGR